MLDYSSKRLKPTAKQTSGDQFSKYIDKMNSVHDIQASKYPGQHLEWDIRNPRQAYSAQLKQNAMQNKREIESAYVDWRREQTKDRILALQLQQLELSTPAGFIGSTKYNPYGRR